jgi:hypothetical protein
VQLVAGVALLGACALHTAPAKPVVMASTQVNSTVDGVRAAVLNLAQDASENTERAADTIAAQARSQLVRVNAIQWKLVSSVELETAALARDPVVALAELILFTLQSKNFLTTGEGREMFATQQPLAIAAVDQNLENMLRYVSHVTPPGARERWLGKLQPWADGHPIQTPYVGRPSSGLSDSLANIFSSDNTALAAIGDIELTARLLDVRVQQIQQSLLKQARWQAELLLADVARQPVVDSLMGQVGRLNASVERITAVAEGAPDLIERERMAALLGVTNERIAVLSAITGERMAVLAAIDSQRIAIVGALHEERVATFRDAEASAQRLIDYTLNQRIELLIDHVLWRLFFGLLLLILVAFVAGLVLVTLARRNVRIVRT